MDVQSAIAEYRRLSPEIFHPSVTKYLGANIAKTAVGMPWFKGKNLEACVKGIVKDRMSWEEKEFLGADAADARLISNVGSTRENSCKTYEPFCLGLPRHLPFAASDFFALSRKMVIAQFAFKLTQVQMEMRHLSRNVRSGKLHAQRLQHPSTSPRPSWRA